MVYPSFTTTGPAKIWLPGFDDLAGKWELTFRQDPVDWTTRPAGNKAPRSYQWIEAEFRIHPGEIRWDDRRRRWVDVRKGVGQTRRLLDFVRGDRVRTVPFVPVPGGWVWYVPGRPTVLRRTLELAGTAIDMSWRSAGEWAVVPCGGWRLADNPFDRQVLACMLDDALDRGADESPYRKALELLEKWP
jgi:hypothetical protein